MTRILRLRGLPFSATEAEIKDFFSEWKLEDVKICKKVGRPTGEAYVRFISEKECSDALARRDKEKLGKRYIEYALDLALRYIFCHSLAVEGLFRAKDQDLDYSMPQVSIANKGHVIRMRGLPFSACLDDIMEFFKSIPSLDRSNVYFVYDFSGRPSGEAYVHFTSAEGQQEALKNDKKEMGSRYIELFGTNEQDVQRAARAGRLRHAKGDGSRGPHKVEARGGQRGNKAGASAAGERAGAAAQRIPNYKPVAMKQLTKTFANVAASPPASGPCHAALNGGSGDGPDGAADPDAVADEVARLDLDEVAPSLFANQPHPAAADSPGGGGGRGRGSKGKGGRGPSPANRNHKQQQQQQHMQHHEGQVWHPWGMHHFGMAGLGMWQPNMMPKGPHDQMQGGYHGGLWQPGFHQHMQQAAYGHGGMDGMFQMHTQLGHEHHQFHG